MVDLANLEIKINAEQIKKGKDQLVLLNRVSKTTDDRFVKINKTFIVTNRRFDSFVTRLRKTHTQLGKVNTRATTLNRNLQTHINRLNSAGTAGAANIRALNNMSTRLRDTATKLRGANTTIKSLSANIRKNAKDNEQNNKAIEEMASALNKTTQKQNTYTKAMGKTRIEMDRVQMIATRVATVIDGLISFYTLRALTEYSDRWVSLRNFMGAVSDSALEAQSRLQGIAEIAKATGAEVQTVGIAFNRFIRATENIDISDQSLLKYIDAFIKSGFLAGSTAHELNGAMRQLGQGLQAGALRGDEFNSVAEQAPLLISAITDTLGVTRGELREIAAEGAITTEILLASLELLAARTEAEWKHVTFTFAQNLSIARTNLQEFLGTNTAAANSIQGLGRAIVFVSEDVEGAIATFLLLRGALFAFSRGLNPVGLALTGFAAIVGALSYHQVKAARAQKQWVDSLSQTELSRNFEQITIQIRDLRTEIELLEATIRLGENDPQYRETQRYQNAIMEIDLLRDRLEALTATEIDLAEQMRNSDIQIVQHEAALRKVSEELVAFIQEYDKLIERQENSQFGSIGEANFIFKRLDELTGLIQALEEESHSLLDTLEELRNADSQDFTLDAERNFIEDQLEDLEKQIELLKETDEVKRRLLQITQQYEGELSEENKALLESSIRRHQSVENLNAEREARERLSESLQQNARDAEYELRVFRNQVSAEEQFIRSQPGGSEALNVINDPNLQLQAALSQRNDLFFEIDYPEQLAHAERLLEVLREIYRLQEEQNLAEEATNESEARLRLEEERLEILEEERENRQDVIKSLKNELRLLMATGQERYRLLAIQALGLESTEQQTAEIERQIAAWIEARMELDAFNDAQRAADEAMRDLERASDRAAQQIQRDWERVRDRLSDAFTDAILDGEDAFDALAKSAQRAALTIINDFAASGVLSLLGGFGGAPGFNPGGTGGFGPGSNINAINSTIGAIGNPATRSFISAAFPEAAAALGTSFQGLLASLHLAPVASTTTAVAGTAASVTTASATGASFGANLAALATNPLTIAAAVLLIAASNGFWRDPDNFRRGIAGFIPTSQLTTPIPDPTANIPVGSQFRVDDFASGLQVTGIADGTSKSKATSVIRQFQQYDKALVEILDIFDIPLDLSNLSDSDISGFGLDGQFIGKDGEIFGISQRTTEAQLAAQFDSYVRQALIIALRNPDLSEESKELLLSVIGRPVNEVFSILQIEASKLESEFKLPDQLEKAREQYRAIIFQLDEELKLLNLVGDITNEINKGRETAVFLGTRELEILKARGHINEQELRDAKAKIRINYDLANTQKTYNSLMQEFDDELKRVTLSGYQLAVFERQRQVEGIKFTDDQAQNLIKSFDRLFYAQDRAENYQSVVDDLNQSIADLSLTEEERFVQQYVRDAAGETATEEDLDHVRMLARELYNLQQIGKNSNQRGPNYVARRFGTALDFQLKARNLDVTDPIRIAASVAMKTQEGLTESMGTIQQGVMEQTQQTTKEILAAIQQNTKKTEEYLEGFEINGMRVRA